VKHVLNIVQVKHHVSKVTLVLFHFFQQILIQVHLFILLFLLPSAWETTPC